MKSFDKKLVLIILIVVFSVTAFFYGFDRPQAPQNPPDPEVTLSMDRFFFGDDDRSGVRNEAGNLLLSIIKSSGNGTGAGEAVAEEEKEVVDLFVKIADTQELMTRGLQGVESLTAEMEGMLFVYPSDADSFFWMKDMTIPLSIAFISTDGIILEIIDMPICDEKPCPLYRPDVLYRYALEVEKGWFDKHKISPGDEIVLPNE